MKMTYQHERQLFFTALMFFTRIPCPKGIDHSDELLNQSARYFPVVGWIIGSCTALVYLATYAWLSPGIAVVLSMATGILLTGAFHEDGFADCCDGFGGGYTPERVLTIMKDSRIGAFGAIGIIMMLLLKATSLHAIATTGGLRWLAAALLLAHPASRFAAFCLMIPLPYVQDIDASKVKPIAKRPPNKHETLFAASAALLPLLLFPSLKAIWILPIAAIGPWLAARYFNKRIGGYTGDCLGATQQITEIIIYLVVVALCR